ncbi:zinc finger protein 726 [Orussus abietinus]|uniref:zinc finger protein 726 n=1 Tax=Orussus abietinus TaxID=222816 RepID=UPI000C715ED5|nr:zinc finger protein 726 [Orussus abietinus]
MSWSGNSLSGGYKLPAKVERRGRKDGGGKYVCNRCGKSYKATTSLSRHKRLECGVIPCEVCPICHRRFKHKFVLNSHIVGCERKLREIMEKKSLVISGVWTVKKKKKSAPVDDYPDTQSDRSSPVSLTARTSDLGKKVFICGQCGKEYAWMWNLRRHQLQCGNKEARNEYATIIGEEIAAMELSSDVLDIVEKLDNFPRHRGQSTPVNDQRFLCGECGKGYKWMDNLRRHQRLECGKLPKYRCKGCLKMFYRRYELTKHINSKHRGIGSSRHQGSNIPKATWLIKTLGFLENATNSEGKIAVLPIPPSSMPSPIASKNRPTKLKPNIIVRKPSKVTDLHLCLSCKIGFTDVATLERHVKYFCGRSTKSHCCGSCKEQFQTQTELDKHMMDYAAQPFPGRTMFWVPGTTDTSSPVSSGCSKSNKQYYVCGECGKSYTWMDSLRRHQKSECGDKEGRYSCSFCGRKFFRRYQLKDHVSIKHMADPGPF